MDICCVLHLRTVAIFKCISFHIGNHKFIERFLSQSSKRNKNTWYTEILSKWKKRAVWNIDIRSIPAIIASQHSLQIFKFIYPIFHRFPMNLLWLIRIKNNICRVCVLRFSHQSCLFLFDELLSIIHFVHLLCFSTKRHTQTRQFHRNVPNLGYRPSHQLCGSFAKKQNNIRSNV